MGWFKVNQDGWTDEQRAEYARKREDVAAEVQGIRDTTASNKALRAERKRRMNEAATSAEKAAVRKWFAEANRDLNLHR